MNKNKKIALGAFLALNLCGYTLPANARVSINVGIPLFYAEPDYHERVYYRTYNHHRYHYDADQGRWHYGRNHREGLREEERRRRYEDHEQIKY